MTSTTAAPGRADRRVDALDVLLGAASGADVPALAVLVDRAFALLGQEATVLVADEAHSALSPLLPEGSSPAPRSAEDLDAAWRVMRGTGPAEADGPALRWWPLRVGDQPLGVLEVHRREGDRRVAAPDRAVIFRLAAVVAHLVAAHGREADEIPRLQGADRRSVRAELIWSLLPPLVHRSPGLDLAGMVSPADDIAGDAFDYAVDHGVLRFGVFDATGHDLRSGMMATLAVAAYRKARRGDEDLTGVIATMDEVLAARAPQEGFVAGAFGELDLRTGRLVYANAGQVPPFVLREGLVVACLDEERLPALGLTGSLGIPLPAAEHPEVQLRPGDVVVLHTDGITEARSQSGDFYALERMAQVLSSGPEGEPLAAAADRLLADVTAHRRRGIGDDATVLLFRWTGPAGRR